MKTLSISLSILLIAVIPITVLSIAPVYAAKNSKSGGISIIASPGLGPLTANRTATNSKEVAQLVGTSIPKALPEDATSTGDGSAIEEELEPPGDSISPQSDSQLEPKIVNIEINSNNAASTQIVNKYSGFEGSEANGWAPADGGLAVSDSYIFEVTNLESKIWDKQGVEILTFSLEDFFGSTEFISDPRVLYDSDSGRWFIEVLSSNFVTNGHILFAVSKTGNPLGSYWVYSITSSSVLPDQPRIAVSGDKFAIVSDNFDPTLFGWTWSGGEYFFFNKASVKSGSLGSFRVYGLDTYRFHLEPAQRVGTGNDIWFVQDGSAGATAAEYLRASGNPNFASFSFASVWLSPVAMTNLPPGGRQPNTSTEVETNDARIISASINGNVLTWASNDACTPQFDSKVRSCIRWDVFDISGGLLLQDMTFGQLGRDLFFPAVSQNNPVSYGLMFGFSSPTDYPSVAEAGQSECDPSGSVNNPQVARVGSGPNLPGRMGDYHGIQYDPTTSNFYGMSDYNQAGDVWSTWIGIFSVTCDVTTHSTSLSLNPISNVPWSTSVTVIGRLTDNNAVGIGIADKQIDIFISSSITPESGGGGSGGIITSATTDANGFYTANIIAPATAGSITNVQARFAAGDVFYSGSDSPIQSFTSLKHLTALTVKSADTPWGTKTKFTSVLTDKTLGGVVLEGKTIHWTGTGVLEVADQITDSSGLAVGTGIAPSTVASGWTYQAQFPGDSQYEAKNGIVKSYSTLQHKVALSLVIKPASVSAGGTYSIQGTLLDNTVGGPIVGRTIIFAPTAPISLDPVLSSETGQYSVTGLTAPLGAGSYTIQAQFAGDSLYSPKTSALKTLTVT